MSVRRWRASVGAALMAGACSTRSPLMHQACYDADTQLAAILQPLESLRARGCAAGTPQGGPDDCYRLGRELERLAVLCPAHLATLMANAVVAYDERQPVKSQQYLDRVLADSRSHPDAAILRARIAIEDGNIPFARRLIEQQIKLAPDHPGLYETYGAALYMGGHMLEARRELTTAAALGAPRWRIAYHLGLVAEAEGRFEEALRLYAEALEANPGWTTAESRLKALQARTRNRG